MKNLLPASGFALLAGFAFFSTGCVAQYESTAPVTSYSSTTLPAAGTVALVMEFRGGEPTPEERAEVRAILADYFSQQGTVLVEDTYTADYLVHAVMERRNPANPSEWTVVETYSANSLRSAGSDEFRWPGGMVEDDYYEPTAFSYVGFGVFYPVFFDFWNDPWRRGHVVLCPPLRRHDNWNNDRWRSDHRWHRPDRWQRDRHPEWNRHDQPDRRRDDRDRRPDNNRPNDNNRNGDHRRGPDRPDNNRHDGNRPGPDHRDNDRHDNDRHDGDRRSNPDRGRPPVTDVPRHDPAPPTTVQRPPSGGDRRPDHVRPLQQPEHRRPAPPANPPPQVAPTARPQPPSVTPPPEVRHEQPRPGANAGFGRGPVVSRPPSPQPAPNPPAPPPRVQPPDRRAGSPNQFQLPNSERRGPPPSAGNPPQVRQERRDPPPPPHAENPRDQQRERTIERRVPPPPERRDPAPDRRPPPKNQDKDQDNDDSNRDHRRH